MNEHHEFRPAQRPDKRSDRPEGRFEARTDGKPERPRRSLRETVCDIDRDILRMLMRRHNLIKRMYNAKGFLEPAEEKSIRESWEAAVSRDDFKAKYPNDEDFQKAWILQRAY